MDMVILSRLFFIQCIQRRKVSNTKKNKIYIDKGTLHDTDIFPMIRTFFFEKPYFSRPKKNFFARFICFFTRVFLSFLKNSKNPISRAKQKRKFSMLQNVLEKKY